jgi:hypothetical protein
LSDFSLVTLVILFILCFWMGSLLKVQGQCAEWTAVGEYLVAAGVQGEPEPAAQTTS